MSSDDRALRRWALAPLAAALAGCMSMAPRYERPAAPVAAQFPAVAAAAAADTGASAPTQDKIARAPILETAANAPTSASAAATAASALDWRRFFGADARRRRLVELALENNRDLRIAVLNIQQARAQFDVRRADEWPTVGAGVAGSRQPKAGGGITSLYTAGLQVTAYELDLFGRVKSLSDVALAQYLATEASRQAVQISLIAAVATADLALQADDALLDVTRRTLATREESFRLTRLKFDNGASSELDLRQAESLLEAARVALAQQTRQRALDENALVLLLGQPLPTDLPAGPPLDEASVLPELPAGLPSEVLTRRPDVRAAEQQLIAANANIGAARAAFFPKITLTGSVGSASSELSGLFQSGSFAWSFAPQLLQPIFDAGRNRANLQVAQAGRDIAVAQYEKAIQSAFREVADALAGRATLGEQLRAQTAQTVAEQRRYDLAELRYRNGASSYLDVLDAQRSLFSAQQAVVQVQAQRLQNLVGLYKVLGGGWLDEPAAAPAR